MQNIDISKLIPHPRNHEFFDNIEDGKWEDFKKSIVRRGVVESIVVTQDLMIVSGHQRVRACVELGILSVPCRITHYPDNDPQTGNPKEDMIIEDLICTNIMQRGIGNVNPMKMAKCIVELERIYGVKNGRPSNDKLVQNAPIQNQQSLAETMGISIDQLKRYKKLLGLAPDLQDMVEGNDLREATARIIVKDLTIEQQQKLFQEIGKETLSKMTAVEVKKQIDIYIENSKVEYQKKLDEEKSKIIEESKKTLEEKRILESDIKKLQEQKVQDTPETIAKLEGLQSKLAEKEAYVAKYNESLAQLTEKNAIINKFMGENTNFQLVSKTSEITLKMMDFTKEMSKYDYLSEVFNEIPDATRREYVRSIYGVLKWARNILKDVRHDDVIGVNKNVIEIKK